MPLLRVSHNSGIGSRHGKHNRYQMQRLQTSARHDHYYSKPGDSHIDHNDINYNVSSNTHNHINDDISDRDGDVLFVGQSGNQEQNNEQDTERY